MQWFGDKIKIEMTILPMAIKNRRILALKIKLNNMKCQISTVIARNIIIQKVKIYDNFRKMEGSKI